MGQVLKRYRKLPKSPLFGLITALVVLSMSITAGIRADASPMPTQTLSGTITTSQTLNPGIVYIVSSDVTVASGSTLTVPAGTIVKFQSGPITVQPGGSLRVTGTAAAPVHFTSIKDDAVGGDSNGDSTASVPLIDDYSQAVIGNDGDINVVFAKFRYSSRAIDATRTSGNIVVTDSTFEESHNAISATGPVVKLYRNKFNNLSPYSINGGVQVALAQDLTKIPLSGIDQNVFTGTNKFSRVVSLAQTILPVGKTWAPATSSGAIVFFQGKNQISGTATMGAGMSMIAAGTDAVEVGGTLNIQSGAWVKFDWSGSLHVIADGNLNIAGDAVKPVRFTSLKDDTVGGDTNGDGNITTPSLGDYSSALTSSSGNIFVTHTMFSYFSRAFQGDVTSMSISDSSFTNGLQAIDLYRSQQLELRRNHFDVRPDQYVANSVNIQNTADISGINLSGADRNIFIGSQRDRTLRLSSSTLPLNKILDVSNDSGVVLWAGLDVDINGTLNLKQESKLVINNASSWHTNITLNGTMNIYNGSVVKYTSPLGTALLVSTGGNLNVFGTQLSPAYFTSIKDDSVGGDTNADGAGSTPSPYEAGDMVHLGGGSIYIAHAGVSYAQRAIVGHSEGSLKVFDSTFKNMSTAIEAQIPHVKIYRNTFNLMPDILNGAIELSGVQDISRIGLSGNDQNFFTGSSSASRIVQIHTSKLPVDRTLTISQASGASLSIVGHEVDIAGTLNVGSDVTLLLRGGYSWMPAGRVTGTVNMGPGVKVKIDNVTGTSFQDSATLNINGTSSNPVVFTSIKDDSVGGDSNGDGSATSPQKGDYGVAINTYNASLNANNVKIVYAGTAHLLYGPTTMSNVEVSHVHNAFDIGTGEIRITGASITDAQKGLTAYNNAFVIFRGSMSGISEKYIQACNWNDPDCSVDAAYVDWGTGGAPATGKVCGQVTVSPWVGGAASNNGLFTSKNCDNSPTPADQLSSSTQHFGQRMSARGIDCGNGFEDACEAMRTAEQCLGAATALAASTSSFPLPDGNAYEQPAQWGNMLASNASAYIQSVEGPDPILSAAGFASQLLGALSTMSDVADAYGTCAP